MPKTPKKQQSSPKQDLKALQKEWYGKLKDSGFEDIEQDEDRLKVWSNVFKSLDIATVEAKQTYSQMTSNFLSEYKFTSAFDKYVWERHDNGISIRDIVLELDAKGEHVYKQKVFLALKRLKVKMFDMYLVGHKEYRE